MAKLPSLEHVKYVRAKGRIYAYFNSGQKAYGKPVYARLPDPADPGFFSTYAALKGVRTKRATLRDNVSRMCQAYQHSKRFLDLKENSQRLYALTLKRIDSLLGEFPVDDLQPTDIEAALDTLAGPGARHVFIAVLAAMYRWKLGKGVPRPTDNIDRVKYGEHDPWPEHVLEAGLKAEHDRTRLAIHLLYFTGQRIGDVCNMRWKDLEGGEVKWTQEKTGKLVEFPVNAELRAELERTPKRGITILTNHLGAPISDDIIRKELKRFAATFDLDLVPHGLRKNAVNAMLEAGCSVAETAAITGQTYQIVEKYARKINRRRLGKQAVLLWEQSRNRKTGGKTG